MALATVQAGDAVFNAVPSQWLTDDLDRLRIPGPMRRIFPIVKGVSAAGLLAGLRWPRLGRLTSAALVVYFTLALGAHARVARRGMAICARRRDAGLVGARPPVDTGGMTLERRRKLRRDMTVEAALARTLGLDVRDQIDKSRKRARWIASGLGALAAFWIPAFFGGGDAALGGVILEAFTVIPMLAMARRAWHLRHAMRALDDEEEPMLTDGDDELARLQELIRCMPTRSAKRAGNAAVAAARQAYKDRRRHFERRHQLVELSEEMSDAARTALEREAAACEADIAALNAQLDGLIASVAHLSQVSGRPRTAAIGRVRDATDAVNALAEAMEELEAPAPVPRPQTG